MLKKRSSCTSILVGKDASLDGSTMIGRDEDSSYPVGPQAFTVRPALDKKHNFLVSKLTGLKLPVPEHTQRYTCEPNVPASARVSEEGGFNEHNVAMSATETLYNNSHFLGYDPLVKKNSINEDLMLSSTLPYITSAREGVQRLGHLIERYGTGQSNGIAFADKNDLWYMETAGGHHWVAVRIPDDCYAIAPNQISIRKIDFTDTQHKNYMWSTGFKDFIVKNNLDPHHGNHNQINFREIVGTHTEADSHYNTPRVWYGQKMFNPEIKQSPFSQHLPFFRKPNHKLSVEDVEHFLASHYQRTPYDPFANKQEHIKPTLRSIAMARNQISHILQLRNNVDPKYAALEWISFGFTNYSPYVPFYANINAVPENYENISNTVNLNNAYWLYRLLDVLIAPHYSKFINEVNVYRKHCQTYGIHRIREIDVKAKSLTGKSLIKLLTKQSTKTANHVTKTTWTLIHKLIKKSLNLFHIDLAKYYPY